MINRYSRQTIVPVIGEEGQKKLRRSTAVVIGCGALGTVISSALVRAGIGQVKIIDRDFIEYHNVKANINIVHRVIEVQGEGAQRFFITKGDNNNAPDLAPVPEQNVIGKVVLIIPKIGWISIMIKNLFTPAT